MAPVLGIRSSERFRSRPEKAARVLEEGMLSTYKVWERGGECGGVGGRVMNGGSRDSGGGSICWRLEGSCRHGP